MAPYLQTWAGYDAIRVLAQAIKDAGSTDGAKIKDAIKAMSFTNVVGLEVRNNVQPLQRGNGSSGVAIRGSRDVSVTGNHFAFAKGPILSRGGVRTTFHVYFPAPNRLENLHSLRLSGIESVMPHPVDGGGHKLIKWLRDTGELTQILERALGSQVR